MGVRERSILTEFQPRQVEWLWKGYIPFGYLTMLTGPPGVGKTALAMAMAARASHDMNVVILSTDDGIADVVLPRLRDSDPPADLNRIWAIDNVRDLLDALSIEPKLLIIDPLSSFLYNRNPRQEMSNLARVANDTQAAFVLIQTIELDKIPEEQNIVRSILEVRPGEGDTKVLTALKHNLGPRPQPFVHIHEPVGNGFRVIPANRRGQIPSPPQISANVSQAPAPAEPSQEFAVQGATGAPGVRSRTDGMPSGLPAATVDLLNRLRAAQSGQGSGTTPAHPSPSTKPS